MPKLAISWYFGQPKSHYFDYSNRYFAGEKGDWADIENEWAHFWGDMCRWHKRKVAVNFGNKFS